MIEIKVRMKKLIQNEKPAEETDASYYRSKQV